MAPTSKELQQVERSLRPYPARPAGAERPDVLVHCLEHPIADQISERLGDAGDGLHSCWDGRGLRLMEGVAGCRLLFGQARAEIAFEIEPGFAWWRAWSELVRPLLSIPIARGGAAVVHASAVVLDGRGIAIAGWAESGKTEVALALCERGARFASDKWSALGADGTLHAMPVPAGLRAWTVPYLPELRRELGAVRRLRAAGGRALAQAVDRAGGHGGGPVAGAARDAARRAADLAGRMQLAPSQDGEENRHAQLSALVVLRSIDGAPAVRELDPATARDRLLTTTAYERRGLHGLDARLRYCGGAGIAGLAELREREQAILDDVVGGCRVVELAAPFPADPRPAADALLTFLQTA